MIPTYNEPPSSLSAWRKDLYHSHAYFEHLSAFWPFERYAQWPSIADYNAHYVQHMDHLPSALQVGFIPLDQASNDLSYEQWIAKRGLVPTRPCHWHDFFNYITWLQWPLSKQALNQRWVNRLKDTAVRKGAHNHLARFEECGLVLQTTPELERLIVEHRWQELFVHNRALLSSKLKVHIYGHGLYEKCLNPYPAMTGFAVFVNDMALSPQHIDLWLQQQIKDENTFLSKAYLQPFPMLGMPKTYAGNEDASFYNNPKIFRPKRNLATAAL